MEVMMDESMEQLMVPKREMPMDLVLMSMKDCAVEILLMVDPTEIQTVVMMVDLMETPTENRMVMTMVKQRDSLKEDLLV